MDLRHILLWLASFIWVILAYRTVNALDSNRHVDFDYFYLVRQWPASFCNEHSCTHRPPRRYAFTVHGLWPQRIDGSWPEFCDPGSELDEDTIEDLLPELEKVWPSWSSDDATFWNHEWTRHGTCAEDVIGGQHAFFLAVLRLHEKLNVQAALQAADIVPSNVQKYPVQKLKDAIEDAYGVMPHITCDQQGELAEVWMCINKKLKPIDCVDDPHPHRAAPTAAAQSSLPGHSNAPASNFYCRDVLIPKLRDDVVQSTTAVGQQVASSIQKAESQNPGKPAEATSAATDSYEEASDAELDIVAAVPDDKTAAGDVEAHVAQLVALDAEQQEDQQQQQQQQQQPVDLPSESTPAVVMNTVDHSTASEQATESVTSHKAATSLQRLNLLASAVLLVAATLAVAAAVVVQLTVASQSKFAGFKGDVGPRTGVDVGLDATPLLASTEGACV